MKKIIYWSVTVAVAGFLFGFDTAVISGADKPIQALWNTSSLFHGLFIMSSALVSELTSVKTSPEVSKINFLNKDDLKIRYPVDGSKRCN